MKEMSKYILILKKAVSSINLEKELLSRINHPFICNICYSFQDEENLYLIVELVNGGDMRYYLAHDFIFTEEMSSKKKIILNL